MKFVLLFVVVGLCVCAVQAATPAPTWGASQIVKASSAPAVSQTTLPTVAGLSADTTSTVVSKAATQAPRATTPPAVRQTTAQASSTTPSTTAPSTKATTPRPTSTTAAPTSPTATMPEPTTEVPTPTADPNLTAPWPTDSLNATLPTPWPNDTAYEYFYPTEDRTPDIDPGMTPYAGPTLLETVEPTPTWEVPVNVSNATPTDPPMAIPCFTAEVMQSPPFELPPGAYGVEQFPSPTETVASLPSLWPEEPAGSSFLPRWLSYLLFIFLGISGVAGLALVGSYLGSRSPTDPVRRLDPLSSPQPRPRETRMLQPGAGETTVEQQALVDLIAGFAPQSMHVERLGRHLLRFEHGAQVGAQDRSIRLGRLIIFSEIPSAPVPAPATAWARAHGFRVLAVDGFGMALVMAALSNGGRSILGVLPVGEMVEGASPAPMSVLFPESERAGAPHPAFLTGREYPPAGGAADGT